MQVSLRKLDNSIGLTFPPALLRDLLLVASELRGTRSVLVLSNQDLNHGGAGCTNYPGRLL